MMFSFMLQFFLVIVDRRAFFGVGPIKAIIVPPFAFDRAESNAN